MSPLSKSSHVTRNATTNDPPCCGTVGPLVYHGGPVQHHPRVYLVFWGSKWQSDPDNVIPFVQFLFEELAGGDYNNILSQYTDDPSDPNYYVHNDVVLAGTWIDTSAVPYISGVPQILDEAGRAMTQNNWSNSPDTQVIVFPQDGTSYGMTGECGEHDYGTDTTGHPLVYSLIFYSTYPGCDFSNGAVNQSMTRAAAHEYAEAATDPEPGFNTAWRASDNSEIGDLCNTITFDYTPVDYGTPIFTQQLWDNRVYQANPLDGCSKAEGQEYYVAAPNLKHTVQGGILSLYQANGATTGFLALPLTEQMPTVDGSVVSYFSGSECGNGGGYGEHSAVFESQYGAAEMHGCIYQHYIGIDAENGQYYITELGVPTSSEMDAPGGGRVNYFYGSSAYSWCGSTGPNWSHAAIYLNGSSAYAVKGCMYDYYQHTAGGPAGSMGLGLPTYEEQPLNGGHIQTFAGSGCGPEQGSAIYDGSGTGIHAVKGCIYYYYNNSYTGTYGAGFPTSDELSMGGGHGQHFANTACYNNGGNGIYDGPDTGVYQVIGCIYQKYLSLNEANSFLGFPTNDETGVSFGRVSYFGGTTWGSNCGSLGPYNSHAAIYWTVSTGAHEVHGCLYDAYVHSYSGPDGMGFPTTDQMSMGGGSGQHFVNSNCGNNGGNGLYEGPGTGVHQVIGCIYQEYLSLNEANSYLGFPTTDEVGVSYGRASYFTGTSWGSNCGSLGPYSSHAGIFWTGSTGAHEVHGCIYDTYNLYGGPGGSLGFPNSDAYVPAGGGWEQTFEHGYIYDSPSGDIHAYICPPSC